MKLFPLMSLVGVALIALSLTSCAVNEEVELTSTTLPADEMISKNVGQLLVGAAVDGQPDVTLARVDEIQIVGKFAIEDQRSYEIYASCQCEDSSMAEGDDAYQRNIDQITLKRLDTNKWVLRYETGDYSRWRIVKE